MKKRNPIVQEANYKLWTQHRRVRISEQKKAELDALAILVLEAQKEVAQFQAIVSSLTEKSNTLQGFLVIDSAVRAQTYANKVLMDQIVQSAKDLKNNAKTASNEITLATVKTKQLAPNINVLIDKLIYVAELTNKFSNLVIRKKALNPLISDDLISMLNTAGKDANDAVALMLIALQATFTAQASNLETQMAVRMQTKQAELCYEVLLKGEPGLEKNSTTNSLFYYLTNAYTTAKAKYETTENACAMVTKQLNYAQAELNRAQVNLKSLQSGLAAANAAALVS